jgi:suppressor for copper-sensitivity B
MCGEADLEELAHLCDAQIMRKSLVSFILFICAYLAGQGTFASATPWVIGKAGHSWLRLISDFDAISADTAAIRVGLEFKLEKNWHTYWKNPGEVGFPPRTKWELPNNWKISDIFYPAPVRIIGEQNAQSFGYQDQAIYPFIISRVGEQSGDFRAKVHVDYLICEVQCIPESADLELVLPIQKEKRATESSLIDATFKLVPKDAPPKSDRVTIVSDQSALLDLSDINQKIDDVFVFAPDKSKITVVPLERSQWKISSDQKITDFEWTATWRDAEGKSGVSGKFEQVRPAPEGLATTFLFALLFAFIGGALLNLMPCVLPVVFLKTFSLLNSEDRQRTSLTFTIAGILSSFVALALITIILKRAGAEVGWGFQFQNPMFVLAMIFVIFLFAFNLFDLFQFELASSSTTILAKAESPFLQGAFAALLATPCSAPFLGTALAYALGQPSQYLILFYLVMGLGLSLPYILLLISPKILHVLPRPGMWMKRFKNFLGYSLLVSALWLLYVFGQQVGALSAFVVLAVALFIFILLSEIRNPIRWVFVIALISASIYFQHTRTTENTPITTEFSEEQFESQLRTGQSLFVVITADWCLTCKYNEKLVLDTAWFRKKLADAKLKYVVYDWTQPNLAINTFLKKYGRVGIPFAMIIRRDKSVLLPELLTQSNVEEALQKFGLK